MGPGSDHTAIKCSDEGKAEHCNVQETEGGCLRWRWEKGEESSRQRGGHRPDPDGQRS